MDSSNFMLLYICWKVTKRYGSISKLKSKKQDFYKKKSVKYDAVHKYRYNDLC